MPDSKSGCASIAWGIVLTAIGFPLLLYAFLNLGLGTGEVLMNNLPDHIRAQQPEIGSGALRFGLFLVLWTKYGLMGAAGFWLTRRGLENLELLGRAPAPDDRWE